MFTFYNYHDGETREKSRFLLFPKIINGELKWLEKAIYRQKYQISCVDGMVSCGWQNIEWINK